ncbi:MAG: DNA methylase [Phycisphaerae bacterium]|nr:DNA methylase [Phycisphaerae bacterium]
MKPIRPGQPRKGSGRDGPGRNGPGRVRPGDRPKLRVMTTTLWEYPSQHYDSATSGGQVGSTMQGDKAYAGATPSWVIWQCLTRYTREGDVIVDPMCGSGTTLDVCADLNRKGVGFDLAPTRDEITQADARELPLDNACADFFFMDPPYSTHIDYSDDPRCIGKLDAGEQGKPDGDGPVVMGEAYYVAMEEVIAEMERVLRPGRYGAIYVSDSFKKTKGRKGGTFMPIGFELYAIARDYMEPVDIISVVRHNAKLQRGNWHKAAEEQNFFLRGFNYLMLFRKPK